LAYCLIVEAPDGDLSPKFHLNTLKENMIFIEENILQYYKIVIQIIDSIHGLGAYHGTSGT